MRHRRAVPARVAGVNWRVLASRLDDPAIGLLAAVALFLAVGNDTLDALTLLIARACGATP